MKTENWKTVRLGDVCEQIRGVSYKPADLHNELDDNSVTLLRANNIYEDALNYDELVYVDSKKVTDSQYLKKGDILICASSGSKNLVGKAACLEEDRKLTFGAFCKVLRTDSINHGFFKHYFFSPTYRTTISNLSAGANINNIRAEDLDNLQIPLPPLETQRQIAAQLDKCTAVIARHKQMLEKYDTLVKSRFIEMFGDNPIDNGKWKVESLEELCKIITDGTHQPPKFTTSGIPFLFVSNIAGNKITYETEKFISEETYAELYKRTPIEIGDLLLSTVGSYGHPAIVENDKKFLFQRHIAYLKPKTELLDSVYFHGALLSPDAQKQIEERVKGIAQKTLNLSEIRKIKIPLPPLSLQNNFAQFVQAVDAQKAKTQQSMEKAETLYKSLMQEYFG
jgi:type I restriction enzyme S subunit